MLQHKFTIGTTLIAALMGGGGPAQAATFFGQDVALVGSATVLGNGNLQLTPPTDGQAGAAWATTAWSTTESFSTTFTFSLAASDFDPMADGITFALQGAGTDVVGTGGGGIGIEGLDVVASVIQTWDNNRLGLVTSGDPTAAQSAGIDLGASKLVTGMQTITYDAGTHTLSVTGSLMVDTDLSDEDLGTPVTFNESIGIDLEARFGAQMYAGFTGGTGLSYADQRITSWTGTAPIPEPETYALFLAGLGLLGMVRRRR